MRNYEIRQATTSDSAQIAEVFHAAFAPLRTLYVPSREAADRQVQLCGAMRIVAGISGRIVGTVEVDRRRQNLHLVGFAVDPDFQGLGIGRAVVNWIEAHFTAHAIELATIRETGNVPVFERMGFDVVTEKVADWCVSTRFECLHEVTMAKTLA